MGGGGEKGVNMEKTGVLLKLHQAANGGGGGGHEHE